MQQQEEDIGANLDLMKKVPIGVISNHPMEASVRIFPNNDLNLLLDPYSTKKLE